MRKGTAIDAQSLCGRTIAARTWAALKKRHPQSTAAAVSAETGIDMRTIRGWAEDGRAPCQPHMGRLINTYGPTLAGEVYAPGAGWTRPEAMKARLAATRAALDAAMAAVDQAMADLAEMGE